MPLQDSDNLIIGRGNASYKITYQDLKDDLNYVPPPTGTINTPTILEPNDGAGGGGTTYYKTSNITDVEDLGGGQTKLTFQNTQNFDKMEGTVFGTTDSGTGPYTKTPYKLTTTDIGNVQVLAGFSYKLYAIPNDNGSADFPAAADLASIPGISTATYKEDVDFGNTPTSNTQAVYSFYELTTPGSMSVIRVGSSAGKNASLAWSDDGETWIGGIFEQPGGIGPDTPIQSDEVHKYWCFWFTDSNHRQDLYTPDATFSTTLLTFEGPSNFDLQYFKQDDVVQDGSVKIDTIETLNYGSIHWIKLDGQYLIGDYAAHVTNSAGGAVNNGARDDNDAFDGDVNTYIQNVDRTGILIDLSSYDFRAKTFEIHGSTGGQSGGLKLNGQTLKSGTVSFIGDVYNLGTDVKVVNVNTANNTMTVDGGDWVAGSDSWNQTQTWTEAPIFNDNGISEYAGRPVINAFDGTIGMSAADGAMPNSGTWNWTFTGFDDAETVEIFGSSRTAGGQNQLNGVAFPEVTYANPVTVDVTGTGLQSLQISGNHGSNYHMVLTGIKVDGRLLVNPGYASPSSKVEYQTTGGEGTVDSVDDATTSIIVNNSTDPKARFIGPNNGNVNFEVAGPSEIDDPLLTNQVNLRASEFATTPADSDTIQSIVWRIKNNTTGAAAYEANAGTVNPWNPTNPPLEPNTNYTVEVKHRGNSLGDSAYSNSISFTTGPTFKSLFDRVSALESNDVIDDATDTALINLIAGLAARIQALEESN